MAPHSSTLAWKIPWMEEPGRLQSMGSLRVGHDWATSLSFSLSCIGEEDGNPLQCSCLEIPRDGGVQWTVISGVAQSQTWLKRLSSKHLPTYCGWKAIVSGSLLFFNYSLGFSKPQHVGVSLTILFYYYSILPYREKPRGRHFPQAHCFSSFNCWNQPW